MVSVWSNFSLAKQDADAAPHGRLGVLLDFLQHGDGLLPGVKGRLEPGRVGLDTQVAQQRLIVDPVEGRVGVGVVFGPAARREGEEVPLLPGQLSLREAGPAAAPDHVVDLRRGVGLRLEALARQDADEVAHGAGLVAGPGTAELVAQVEGHDPRRALLVQAAREIGIRHPAGLVADRVGRLAVLEVLRILRPAVDGRSGRGSVSTWLLLL